jgi:hypothetical protein
VEGFGRRTVFVGDARALFRLIFALSTNQAVLHDLLLEGMLRETIGRERFGIRVGEFVERRFGREMGEGWT